MAIINQVVSGGGSPAPSGKYQLLQRVKDDSNNEIGTVCGFHTDANNVEYAVVCLDAQYRSQPNWNFKYMSAYGEIPDLPIYNSPMTVWSNTDTATFNCTKILDYATANGYTSTAVSHCRNQSFVIDGTTYYGQLPTIIELVKIFMNAATINAQDTSLSGGGSGKALQQAQYWSSCQYSGAYGFYMTTYGTTEVGSKTQNSTAAAPILELPNA